MNVKHYKDCPPHLRRGLIYIIETATKLARRKVPGVFLDPLRSKVCTKRFNDKLAFPGSSNEFEYVDIVLSHNTILPAHLDKTTTTDLGTTTLLCTVTSPRSLVCSVASPASCVPALWSGPIKKNTSYLTKVIWIVIKTIYLFIFKHSKLCNTESFLFRFLSNPTSQSS